MKEVLKALGRLLVDDGRLESVSAQRDKQQTFTIWRHKNEQGNLLDPVKVKEGKKGVIDCALKQKLFDYVPESDSAERQSKPYSFKFVLKNKVKQVRARLTVKDQEPNLRDEKIEPSDVHQRSV